MIHSNLIVTMSGFWVATPILDTRGLDSTTHPIEDLRKYVIMTFAINLQICLRLAHRTLSFGSSQTRARGMGYLPLVKAWR